MKIHSRYLISSVYILVALILSACGDDSVVVSTETGLRQDALSRVYIQKPGQMSNDLQLATDRSLAVAEAYQPDHRFILLDDSNETFSISSEWQLDALNYPALEMILVPYQSSVTEGCDETGIVTTMLSESIGLAPEGPISSTDGLPVIITEIEAASGAIHVIDTIILRHIIPEAGNSRQQRIETS